MRTDRLQEQEAANDQRPARHGRFADPARRRHPPRRTALVTGIRGAKHARFPASGKLAPVIRRGLFHGGLRASLRLNKLLVLSDTSSPRLGGARWKPAEYRRASG